MYFLTLSGTRYLILPPLLTAVLILVELTRSTGDTIPSLEVKLTVIGHPLCDYVDVMLVQGEEVGVVDKFLWVGSFPK